MSKQIEKYINEVALRQINTERAKLEQCGQTIGITEIVRHGYERWVELASIAKRNGEASTYKHLSKVFAEEFGVNVSAVVVRAAFSKVRLERGERCLRKNGIPYANRYWSAL